MNFIANILAPIYFYQAPTHSSNHELAFLLNSISIFSYAFLIFPFIFRLRKKSKIHSLSQQFTKFMALSSVSIPIFSAINLLLSCVCLYTLISKLFKWTDYDYLFVTYSLVGASLSMIISYCKIRFDCVIIFSLEIYKFFLLVIGTTIFGVIAVQSKVDTLAISVAWFIFLYKIKSSLERDILYYILLILQSTLLITACVMIVTYSKQVNLKQYVVIIFYLSIILQEMKRVKNTLMRYSNDLNFDIKRKSPQRIYYKIAQLKKQEENPQNTDVCSICLDKQNMMDPMISLKCKHIFHIDCIYEWILINQCCPLCRKQLDLLDDEEQKLMC